MLIHTDVLPLGEHLPARLESAAVAMYRSEWWQTVPVMDSYRGEARTRNLGPIGHPETPAQASWVCNEISGSIETPQPRSLAVASLPSPSPSPTCPNCSV